MIHIHKHTQAKRNLSFSQKLQCFFFVFCWIQFRLGEWLNKRTTTKNHFCISTNIRKKKTFFPKMLARPTFSPSIGLLFTPKRFASSKSTSGSIQNSKGNNSNTHSAATTKIMQTLMTELQLPKSRRNQLYKDVGLEATELDTKAPIYLVSFHTLKKCKW